MLNFFHLKRLMIVCDSMNLIGAAFEPIGVLPLAYWCGYSENAPIVDLRVRNAVQTEKYK
jgi:hypothetical protein